MKNLLTLLCVFCVFIINGQNIPKYYTSLRELQQKLSGLSGSGLYHLAGGDMEVRIMHEKELLIVTFLSKEIKVLHGEEKKGKKSVLLHISENKITQQNEWDIQPNDTLKIRINLEEKEITRHLRTAQKELRKFARYTKKHPGIPLPEDHTELFTPYIKHGTLRAFFIVRPHGFEPWTPEV
jgi:hypothetical protein